MSDRTLVLLKPDAVRRGLVGEIIGRLEAKQLSIGAMDLRTLDAETLSQHYAEHVGKGFYDALVGFMSSGPIVAMVVEGSEDTWEIVRGLIVATFPLDVNAVSIIDDLDDATPTENLVHGSDSLVSAEREVAIF